MEDTVQAPEQKTEVQPSEFEKENKPFNLQDRLAKATEPKAFKAQVPEAEKAKEAPQKQTSLGLGSDDDFIQPKKPEPKAAALETDPKKDFEPEEGPITEKAKRSSARTAVGMLDLTQKGIFQPLHTWKFKRKFNDKEVEKLDVIEDKEDASLDANDLALKKKWNRLLKKYNKKFEDVSMKDAERKDLEEAFYQYFDFKQKTLPPEWFVGMAILNSVGSRTIDLITD